jgi:chromosome segregation ATPase
VSLLIARQRGQHRAIDRVAVLEHRLARAEAGLRLLQQRLAEANDARDKANARASQLEDQLLTAAEATRQNQTAVSSLTAHPAVADTQPFQVLPLHLAPFASISPTRIPGGVS